ncbi:flp pilus assembly surface protein TadF [Pectobacterium odoriferum]|uniref:Flp pilus assembly surface protein TadF n=1 Tax=Pectobacterium odoriferum TaxID=78398 RepID=A0ABD6VU17_9GAMM|nr:flp pilus assembly surface protein TadF [Pectobacterium odoriferum]MCH5009333.1 flp pilus assembly surface protein TadF [Pectobacterium odoriferum]POD91194.1 flp pilus assembly surface protein TadF [Pectobacterium odoriferum]POD97220.1 flp pilus assembly surface protein TadF [Pectobacterium odoriferum]POE02351.1 flp pilus assembly surface protein TadF [Pectobacterium odoriferum]
MFRNLNVANFLGDRRGAVAIEFVIISIVLIFMIFFISDLVMRQAMVGKLDRVSYSVAGILRERNQLFDEREKLEQRDIEQSLQLAVRMLRDMHTDADLSKLRVRVEEVHFNQPDSLTDTSQTVKLYRTWQAGSGGECQAPQPLNQLTYLSPRGSYGRWVPLYQVSVCLPTISWFTRLTAGLGEEPVMSSFAIVMVR